MGVCSSSHSLIMDTILVSGKNASGGPKFHSIPNQNLSKTSKSEKKVGGCQLNYNGFIKGQNEPKNQVGLFSKIHREKHVQDLVDNDLNNPKDEVHLIEDALKKSLNGKSNKEINKTGNGKEHSLKAHQRKYENRIEDVNRQQVDGSINKMSNETRPTLKTQRVPQPSKQTRQEICSQHSDIRKLYNLEANKNREFRSVCREVKVRSTSKVDIPGRPKSPGSSKNKQDYAEKKEDMGIKEKQLVFNTPSLYDPNGEYYLLLNSNGIKNLVPKILSNITTSSILQKRMVMNMTIVPSDELIRRMIPSPSGTQPRFL